MGLLISLFHDAMFQIVQMAYNLVLCNLFWNATLDFQDLDSYNIYNL